MFGPYFPAGAAAELRLAETLLRTNNDEDAREAQVHLAQLRVGAETPQQRAGRYRCVLALAKGGELIQTFDGVCPATDLHTTIQSA